MMRIIYHLRMRDRTKVCCGKLLPPDLNVRTAYADLMIAQRYRKHDVTRSFSSKGLPTSFKCATLTWHVKLDIEAAMRMDWATGLGRMKYI